MAPKRRRRPKPAAGKDRAGAIGLRRLDSGAGWALVHPKCAVERADDLEEVRAMIEAGETEIARDELRYLLSGCPDLIEAHALCGELATGDLELARGHFGYAFGLGEKALSAAKCEGPLPGGDRANAPWYDAALGLAWCFEKLGRGGEADRIAQTACRYDASDPAGIRAALDELRSGGLPMVSLG